MGKSPERSEPARGQVPSGEARGAGEPAPEPPPVYSLPLAVAASNCPTCERPFRFEMRSNKQEMDGRLLRCECGTVLGRYVVRVAGMLWLEVACPTRLTGSADRTTILSTT